MFADCGGKYPDNGTGGGAAKDVFIIFVGGGGIID